MRSYSVAIASLAISAPTKWTDNAIAQHGVEGVISEARGVPRRITFPALLTLAIAREIHLELHTSVSKAIELASLFTVGERPPGQLHFGSLTLSVDLRALRQQLEARLAEAIESAPQPPRGRPIRADRDK